MKRIPKYSGILKMSEKVTKPQVVFLSDLLGEDWQEYPERHVPDNVHLIPLYFNEDCSGLVYASYKAPPDEDVDMVKIVNALIEEMQMNYPDFGIKGSLVARSHHGLACWELFIGEDGFAHKRDIKTLECPHCGGDLALEGISGIRPLTCDG
jgi:hypothetical protein